MTAGRRAAGPLRPRGGVGVSATSKMRRALRGIALALLRRRSGLRVKKRARVGGRRSPRVIAVPSAADAAPTETRDDRDRRGDSDGDGGDSVSSAESDSSDVVFVDETPARASPGGGRLAGKSGPDVVRAAASALGARAKSERGMGNCMFCAGSSGINTWLASARGSAGKAAHAALFTEDANARKAVGAANAPPERSKGRRVTWAHLRVALARHLRDIARDAPLVAGVVNERGPFVGAADEKRAKKRAAVARARAMATLMEGEQGRAWLSRGALRGASTRARFEKYVEAMATDAAPFAGKSTWRRYWGADNELVVLAAKTRVAMVCVEAATETGGAFLAVPADVAETDERARGESRHVKERAARNGRYVCGGAFETSHHRNDELDVHHAPVMNCLRWRASRGAVTLTVFSARADSKAARRAVGGDGHGVLPALVVVHRPGHFDSLQPEEGHVFVMERRGEKRGGSR